MNNKFWQSEANKFTVYGALFGFLFPIIASLLRAFLLSGSISWSSIIEAQRSDPLLWIIDTAPFFLGLFARFAGRRQDHLKGLLEQSTLELPVLEEPIEDATQFASLLSVLGMALIAVVLIGLSIWLQRLILSNQTPAEALNDAVGNPEVATVQLVNITPPSTNTPVQVVVQPTPLPPTATPLPPTPIQLPPTLTPTPAEPTPLPTEVPIIVTEALPQVDTSTVISETQPALETSVSDAPGANQNVENLPAVEPPTPTPEDPSQIILAYADRSADCTFFTQLAAQVWAEELGITSSLVKFQTSDDLYQALAELQNSTKPMLTLCFLDPEDRIFLRKHTDDVQVIGKAYWQSDAGKLLTLASSGTPSILRDNMPGVLNFLQNQEYSDGQYANQDATSWLNENRELIRSWLKLN